MPRTLSVTLLVFALPAMAQSQVHRIAPDRDVRLGGTSIVGRWSAVEVVGDAVATADLRRGALSVTLAVNPTGHVILRGTDLRQDDGRPTAFSGRIDGRRARFRGLDGEAELALHGRRLHLVDPRGRQTVFVRGR